MRVILIVRFNAIYFNRRIDFKTINTKSFGHSTIDQFQTIYYDNKQLYVIITSKYILPIIYLIIMSVIRCNILI